MYFLPIVYSNYSTVTLVQDKIIGGDDAQLGQFPWQVSLYYNSTVYEKITKKFTNP